MPVTSPATAARGSDRHEADQRSARRDVKGALIKTAAALPHLIIASLLWLVPIAALPSTIGLGVAVLGAFVLVLLTFRRKSGEGGRRNA